MTSLYPLGSSPLGVGFDGETHSQMHGRVLGQAENVLAYGADPTGNDDSYTAIAAAIAAIGDGGGTVFFPKGTYKCGTSIDLQGRRSVILQGVGGLSAGALTASCIQFSITGSGPGINARNSAGVWIKDLAVEYTSTSYNGYLIDFCNNVGDDTAYGGVVRCLVGGRSTTTAATLIGLDKAILMSIRDCYFHSAHRGILGRSETGYSYRVTIDGCTFSNLVDLGIQSPGGAWRISNCEFNPLVSGEAGAIGYATNCPTESVVVDSCWMGDVVAGGYQMTFAGTGINVTGNWIGGTPTTTAIRFNANNNVGVTITGNYFTSLEKGIDFQATTGNKAVIVGGNYYAATATEVTGTLPTGVGSIIDDTDVTRITAETWFTAASNTYTGTMYFGSLADANLYRSGAGVLATDSTLRVGGPIGPQNTAAYIYSGANTPEGAVTAAVGSIFLRTNGGVNTCIYVKESGAGNTGWVPK